MKRSKIAAAILATGLAPGLCAAQLPGLPMTGFTAGGTGLTPFYVMGFELGPWQDYLAQELTPSYMEDLSLAPANISWLDPEIVSILPSFASGILEQPKVWTRYQVDWQYLDSYTPDSTSTSQLQAPGLGFERQLLTPGVFHQLDENSVLGVEAVLAYQSYGTTRLGMQAMSSPQPGFNGFESYSPYQESGYGTGVRLNVSREFLPGMTFGAGFQSRIDMEEFAYHRGVYSSPADFDIPARASVAMAFQTNQQSWLNVSIERVMYSDVSAFPSRLLPDRLLSQLGDSTSPTFAWNDLTVYTVGWTWNNEEDTQWRVDVSSRSTPTPTSRNLQRAIREDLADHAVTLGYSKRTSDLSRFNVNAAYAPSDFIFGGNVLGVATESLDQALELEARWTLDF